MNYKCEIPWWCLHLYSTREHLFGFFGGWVRVDEYLSVQISVLVFTRKYKGNTSVRLYVYMCVEWMQVRWDTITANCGAVHRLNTLQLGAAA